MTLVRFVSPAGDVVTARAAPGARLLDVAQAAGQPLEGTCGGDMACATCHVRLDPADLAHLPSASGEEEDLLDLVSGAGRTSRLACQITVPAGVDSLTVHLPA